MNDLTHLLGGSRKRVLDLTKDRGEVTTDEAAEALGLATTTVRQHFHRLEDDDLVDRTSRSDGPGRPTVYFHLTSKGKNAYPSADTEMLTDLLDFLSQQGYHRVIDDFFRHFWERRRQVMVRRLESSGADTLEERLDILRDFLDEKGFMPEIDVDDDSLEIRECNCPLRGAVASTRLPCRLESEFLEQIVGQSLTRAEYIPDGHHACVYRFRGGDDEDDGGDL